MQVPVIQVAHVERAALDQESGDHHAAKKVFQSLFFSAVFPPSAKLRLSSVQIHFVLEAILLQLSEVDCHKLRT